MRHLTLIAMLLFAGSVSAAQSRCTTLYNGKTLSHWAGQGNLTAVKALIQNGCDVDSISFTDTPLLAAIKSTNSGTIEVMKWLIKNGADVFLRDSSNRIPLMHAALHNNLAAAKLVIHDAETTVYVSDETKEKAISALSGYYIIGYDIGKKALNYARTAEMFELLISHYASVNYKTSKGLTAWHTAAEYLTEAYIVDIMVASIEQSGINEVHFTEDNLMGEKLSPLMLAASQNRPSGILRRLIYHGVKTETTAPGDYRTALHYAARKGHIVNVRRLIKSGANVNAGRDVSGGMSPIFAAVEGARSIERTQVVKRLIVAGGKVTDAAGNKPSVSDEHEDAAALKAIIDNPKPYWPIRAYALGIPFNPPASNALATTSWLDIGCHESGGSCLVHFDCTDNSGAKTGNATLSAGATVTYSDSASSPNTTTIAGRLGLGAGQGWQGRLDCALRSQQKIKAQVWSRTGITLANTTGYIHSDENNEAILQKVHHEGSTQGAVVRIRCVDEKVDCKSTTVKCRSAAGTTASYMSIDVGKIDRLKTTTLYNDAREGHNSDFPAGIAACTVKSKGAFLAQVLANSNGVLLNHTGIVME